mmetsp:Transcript_1007/g.3063  ORF Transcript_1007/g.3063 Transcript_1007/m.3063 type:complete len:232 (+) Transcript_1007:1215-1910(+)
MVPAGPGSGGEAQRAAHQHAHEGRRAEEQSGPRGAVVPSRQARGREARPHHLQLHHTRGRKGGRPRACREVLRACQERREHAQQDHLQLSHQRGRRGQGRRQGRALVPAAPARGPQAVPALLRGPHQGVGQERGLERGGALGGGGPEGPGAAEPERAQHRDLLDAEGRRLRGLEALVQPHRRVWREAGRRALQHAYLQPCKTAGPWWCHGVDAEDGSSRPFTNCRRPQQLA